MFFLSFFQVIRVYSDIQDALSQTASYAAKYVYLSEELSGTENNDKDNSDSNGENKYDKDTKSKEEIGTKKKFLEIESMQEFLEGMLDEVFIRFQFCFIADSELLNSSRIKYGVAGISFFDSEILEEGNDISIVARYKLNVSFPFFELPELNIVQRVQTKAFLGASMQENEQQKEEDEQKKETVYVTETGSVYHLSRECTYIKISVQQVSLAQIASYRNGSGAIYYPCDICCESEKGEKLPVYITKWGNSYHISLSCRELKRTVIEKTRTEAEKEGYHACSKCGT